MLSFENTEIAFKSKSTPDLKRAYWLFKIVSSPIIVKIGKVATNFALSLGYLFGKLQNQLFSNNFVVEKPSKIAEIKWRN